MKKEGMDRSEVEALLHHFQAKNIGFRSGRIFGSMCTEPHPYALEVHSRFHESNLGNPGLCPGTLEMEREVVSMLGRLLHLDIPYGHVLSGGTEANITAMYAAKKKSSGRKVLYPRSAHFSILKAIKLLDMEPVPVGVDEDYRMDLSDLESKITDDVAMVIGVAGTTELGAVDPIGAISDLVDGPHLHVDAAFGGFVLPFLEEMGMTDGRVGSWDFRVEGVASLSTDPHKMGWSTIPAGCFLFREEDLLKYLAVGSPYLTSPNAYTLAGTRDSGAVASAFALMKLLGREGYCQMVRECMENTLYLKNLLTELHMEIVMEPVMNIVAVRHDEPQKVQRAMSGKGYYISRVCDPPALRFVVMPHVNREAMDSMVGVLSTVVRDV